MRVKNRFQDLHVVRTADEDRAVIALPVSQEWLEQRRAVPHHELNFCRHVRIDRVPVFVEYRERIERDKVVLMEKGQKNRPRSRKSRAQPGMGNAIINEQHMLLSSLLHPGRENGIQVRFEVFCQQLLMPNTENALVLALEVGGAGPGIGARELIMEEDGIGIVHDAQPLFPKARAVVRLFVICGLESLIEAAKFFPNSARCRQKGPGTGMDVTAEHVHRGERIISPSVTQARTVAPNDAAGVLQCAVEQNKAAAHRADTGSATDGGEGGMQCPGEN